MVPAEGSPVYVIDDGLIRWRGKELRLSPKEAQLFELFVKLRPHPTRTIALAEKMYPGGLPQDPDRQVCVYIAHLRKKLAFLPLTIENRPGWGYWLEGELDVV